MPKLFLLFVFFLLPSIALARDALCPAPINTTDTVQIEAASNEELFASMQQAQKSALQLDWVNDDNNTCRGFYQEPENLNFQRLLSDEQADTFLSADNFTQSDAGIMQLSGNVQVYQGARRFSCDTLFIDRQRDYSELRGNVQLREAGVLFVADHATIDKQTQQSTLLQSQFLFHESMARGRAEKITLESEDNTQAFLENSQFTFCPPEHEHWAFQAKNIELDQEKGWGTLRSAVFKAKNIPVMYIPYLNFPLDDRRKTGVLWPTITGGRTYFDIAVPIYFNLAPHYDMTYTPRIHNKHGYLHNIEGRYKQKYSEWMLTGAYIDADKRVNDEKTKGDAELNGKRWLGGLKQTGQFNANWSSSIDYTAVSDIHYFRDWGTTGLDIQKSLNIKREAVINFNNSQWTASVRMVDYENLEYDALTLRQKEEDYKLWPAISVLYRNNQRSFTVEPLFQAQYSYFQHDSRVTGHRLYSAAGATFPMRWQAVELIPSAQVKTVQYNLSGKNSSTNGSYDKDSHGVQVPTFSVDGRMYFERFDGENSSTLSPRLFYYYAHHRKQDKLPNFDTGLMAFSYQQLWRESRFSGFDRIDDANQLSLGLDNSWAVQGRTVFDVGVGQMFYFNDRLISPNKNSREYRPITATMDAKRIKAIEQANYQIYKSYYRRSSDIAAQASYYPAEFHTIRTSLIHDPYQKRISETAIAYHYNDDKERLFNLAYRYQFNSAKYDIPTQTLLNQKVEQVEGSFYVPINQQWYLYASSQYDLTHSEFIENLTGVKYEGCCWGIMLAYKRERKTFSGNTRVDETAKTLYRNYWFFQFELKGFGGITDTISRLLEERIEGYQNK